MENNKVLMYSTEIYIQYVITIMEKIKKECIYVYNWVTLLYSRGWHNIINQLYIKKKMWHISLVAQKVKNLPAVQETLVWSHGQEDALEKELEIHSSILA